VANHLSRIARVSEDSPIRDDFLDDHLYILYSISNSFPTPWFANIMNYLVASVFPPLASKAQNNKIIFGMTPICGSCAVTRLLGDAFQTMRLTQSCNSVIFPHQVAILAYRGELARFLIVVSIGPPSSRMHGESVAFVSLVTKQVAHFHGDRKCLNNLCYSVRCLMSGV